MVIKLLKNPTDGEVDTAATVLMDSMHYNPFLQAVSDWNPELLHLILRGRVAVGAKDKSIYVSVNDQGVIEGVMYINPPGISHGQSTSTPEGPPRYRERMRDPTNQWQETFFGPWWTEFCLRTYGESGTRDSVYVNLLGVSPSAQKKGLGKALIRIAHDMADEHGVETTLCTQNEENMEWYKKMGYEVVTFEEVELQGKPCPCWGMIRPAKSKT